MRFGWYDILSFQKFRPFSEITIYTQPRMVGKKEKRVGSPSDHLPRLLSGLRQLQTRDKFTDVVFHCQGGSVSAHKAFLGRLSPLLTNMFEAE